MTKSPTLLILTIIFIFTSAKAEDFSSKNHQTIKEGNCNLIISNPLGGSINLPNTISCPGTDASKSAADSLQKMARFIEASNPTELMVSDVKMLQWANDAEPYLTLSLENSSNLPAEKVKVEILDPVYSKKTKPRYLKFSPSNIFYKKIPGNIAVPKNETMLFPIGPESEIIATTIHQIPAGYEFIGVSTQPNIPDSLTESYILKKRKISPYSLRTISAALIIQLKYETIFGGKITKSKGLFFYYGSFN